MPMSAVPVVNDHEYVNNSLECIFCSSSDIRGGFIDVNGNEAYQPITCGKCGGEWDNIYKLIGYMVTDPPPGELEETDGAT